MSGDVQRVDHAAERLTEAALESWRTATEHAARQQRHAAAMVLDWAESSMALLRAQAAANCMLIDACTEMIRLPFSDGAQEWHANGGTRRDERATNGQGPPLEDYDRLSVEEICARLPDLDYQAVESIRAYEMAHKNRRTLLERLDRSLV